MRRGVWWAGVLICAAGCGGEADDRVPVSGVVKVNGAAVPHAVVTFVPDGETAGHGGAGTTGPDGRYEVTGPDRKPGLPPGAYKVVVSRRLDKAGNPPPPDVGPMDSDARETLPEVYSSPERTQLKATVAAGKPQDFDLKAAKR